jgi:hypothetical protein
LIYVNRNVGLIPQDLLDKAVQAQQELEKLPAEQRAAYIKSKSDIWRAFKTYLAQMSYGKCWYSESPEVQSFLDVDHYRPKLEAKRSGGQCDPGYDWLAFSWENFRLAAQRSNRLSTNEDTDETEGKGSWFPLLDGSPSASWDNRCVADEKPVLVDPAVKAEVDLIDVDATGQMVPSPLCVGPLRKHRVKRSIEIYGLNLPRITDARRRVMRDVSDLYEMLMNLLEIGQDNPEAANQLKIEHQVDQIRQKTFPDRPYARAARAQLQLLPGGMALSAQAEDMSGMAGAL